MHFLTVVLLPQEVPLEETTVLDAITDLIAPYYSLLEGPRHKEYYHKRAIQHLADRYGVQATNLPKLATKLRKALGMDCGVDERGLYLFTNLNPAGKYNYWTLVDGREGWPQPDSGAAQGWLVKDMPRDLLPSAVVTLDGTWHEVGVEKWAWEQTEGDKQAIRERAYTLIDQYPAHRAIPLDCHA